MKKLTLLILLLAVKQCIGQKDSDKTSDHRCVVLQLNGPKLKGMLYHAGDSSVTLKGNYAVSSTGYVLVPVNNIDIIRIRGKRNRSKGWFYGGLAGGVGGAIVGLMIPLKKSNYIVPARTFEQMGNTLAGLGIGAIGGGLVGMLIGSASVKIPLNGDQKKYDGNRKELIRYSLMQK